MSYDIKRKEPIHGMCPPGYEKVRSYYRNGEEVQAHCRKIRVKGRMKSLTSGLYNEGMIGQEDIRLGFDSIVDSTSKGEKNAETIERRARKIEQMMREQESRKEEVRRNED